MASGGCERRAGELGAHQVGEQLPVPGQVLAHVVEPGRAVPPGGEGRLDAEHAHHAEQVRRAPAPRGEHLVRAHVGERPPDAGEVERLGRGGERDRASGHLRGQ